MYIIFDRQHTDQLILDTQLSNGLRAGQTAFPLTNYYQYYAHYHILVFTVSKDKDNCGTLCSKLTHNRQSTNGLCYTEAGCQCTDGKIVMVTR